MCVCVCARASFLPVWQFVVVGGDGGVFSSGEGHSICSHHLSSPVSGVPMYFVSRFSYCTLVL